MESPDRPHRPLIIESHESPSTLPAGAGESTTLTLQELYGRELAQRGYRSDPAQREVIGQLETLRARLLNARTGRRLARWLRNAPSDPATQGLYLWGSVGRGKTWLMDLFYDSVPNLPRQRAHFHHFMRDVHESLRQLNAQRDPLREVARQLADQGRLICLDELFVSDIADAMILGGLFEALLQLGVTLVITSNQPPAELYRDGLQRARFLPAIALLQQRLQVLCVGGTVDYRLRQMQRRPIYFAAQDPQTSVQLHALFEQLAGAHGDTACELTVQGRRLHALQRRGSVVWFRFTELCEAARSQNDYVELAQEFHTVLLSDVPLFSEPQQDDAARRFIALVDELYDQGVKLVMSAAAPPTALYRAERLRLEFQRTASRLVEMQSEAYLARAHGR